MNKTQYPSAATLVESLLRTARRAWKPSRTLLAAGLGLAALAGATGCATTTERLGLPPLPTVAKVDLNKYVGTWYEIAAFPIRAERNCTGVTATYTLRDDGEIDVLNQCRQFALDGPVDAVQGRARVTDAATNAKLEVSFFRPFWGDYWVIDLAPDYSYAVVGHPSRDYLWILSRTPQLAEATYSGILERLKSNGYELDRLKKMMQPATPLPTEVEVKTAGAAPDSM